MDQGGKSEQIKLRLAESMKHCMKTSSVEKITVQQIVGQCGTTRQTFYRNFSDKYDLINWYFEKLLLESFEHMGEGKTIYEGLVKKFNFIFQEQEFFTKAFRMDEQNCLKDYDFRLIQQFYTERIAKKTGATLDGDTEFLLEMYCRGSIYMTVKWVLDGMKLPPEELSENLVNAIPEKLRLLFLELKMIEDPA
ncbi:MAG: TetR/AcrR family transcriptional regulator C-terminal domain-containing protein [Oscillospiraceae bacterium]